MRYSSKTVQLPVTNHDFPCTSSNPEFLFFFFSFHLKSHDTNSNSEPQRQRKPCRLVISGVRNGKSGVSVFSSPSKLKLNPQKLIIHSLTRPSKIVAGPANAAMTRQELKLNCQTCNLSRVTERSQTPSQS